MCAVGDMMATINPTITKISPMVSGTDGTCPRTGQAISAASPGANAGKTAAHDSPAYQAALAALGDGADRDIRIIQGA
jgi:hypothetical protein